VIIANYCLAHNIAPNISPFIRYGIYFRISSTAHGSRKRVSAGPQQSLTGRNSSDMKHRPESMLDVWLDWPGLRQHMRRFISAPVAAPVTIANSGQVIAGSASIQFASDGGVKEEECIGEESRQLAMALERSKHDM
jgi:hypothetical protein